MTVNGREYPMWSQFVESKQEWIGGELVEYDMGCRMETVITDVALSPNGDESAFMEFCGEEFTCGGDVKYLGISGELNDINGITFRGYGGHKFAVSKCPKEER